MNATRTCDIGSKKKLLKTRPKQALSVSVYIRKSDQLLGDGNVTVLYVKCVVQVGFLPFGLTVGGLHVVT